MPFIHAKGIPNFTTQSDSNSWNTAASVASFTTFPQSKSLLYHYPVGMCAVGLSRWYFSLGSGSYQYFNTSTAIEAYDVSKIASTVSTFNLTTNLVPYDYSTNIDVALDGSKALVSYNQTLNSPIITSFNFDSAYSLAFVSRPSGGNSWATLDIGKGGIYVSNTANMIFTSNSTHVHKYVGNAYNLASITYDSAMPVGTTTTNDLWLSEDGSKLYTIGSGNDRIYQYNLSTNWNLSTASLYGSYNISGIDSTPTGLCLSLDGLYAYFLGRTNARIYRLELGTAHDITTASYSSNYFAFGTSTGLETSVRLRDGGSYLYYDSGYSVVEVSLPTPYSLSGASKTGVTMSLTRRNRYSYGMAFSSDGSHVYTGVDKNIDKINLSTAWNLSSNSYQEADEALLTIPSSRFSVGAIDAHSARYGDSGNKLFVLSNSDILQYDLSTPYDIKTATYNTKSTGSSFGTDFSVSSNRILTYTGTTIKSYILTKSWNVASMVTDSSNNKTLTADCIFVPSGGTDLLHVSDTMVYKQSMPTAYKPSTSYYRSNNVGWYSDATSGYDVRSLSFSTDGTKMFYLDYNTVKHYTLSSPWDIETSTLYTIYTVDQQYTNMRIAYDGINAYLGTDANVKHVVLSSPYNFSSFTSSGVLVGANKSFYVNNQGTKLYKLNSATLSEYTLANRWNVSSAISTGNTYTFASTPTYADFIFSDTNKYLFYITRNGSNLGNTVQKYSMGSNGNINSLTLASSYTVPIITGSLGGIFFKPYGNEYYVSDMTSRSVYNLTV